MNYINQLSKDKKLRKLIAEHGYYKLTKRKNVCLRLCSTIMSQQLSTKVAAVIYQRFLDLFNGKEPSPSQIITMSHEKLRGTGLSNSKVTYIHNVARFAIEKGMDHKRLNKMSVDEVMSYLIEIKGVGKWTIEMILIFTLGREDIFAPDDVGIQNAIAQIYGLDKTDKKKFRNEMLLISEKWIPFRTFACLHLWKWKDEINLKKKRKAKKTENQAG